jgi:hypothetical protein
MKYLTSVLTESLPFSTPSPSAVLERVGGGWNGGEYLQICCSDLQKFNLQIRDELANNVQSGAQL